MMNTGREYLKSNNQCIHISSGSFGEGLEMKEDNQPDFTELQLVYTNDQIIHNDCEKLGYDYYYSRFFLFKRNFADNTCATVHGPCLSDKRGILDLAYCLHKQISNIDTLAYDIIKEPHFSQFRNAKAEMPIAQLSKFLLIFTVILSSEFHVVPDELRIDADDKILLTAPVAYTHFLRFLCHWHLHNTRLCRDSLRDLPLTIAENYFIANLKEKASSYNLLGIIF
ncbi:unnamed protein product [Mytilus coruscus]|uniref:Uncharacterized protein n=1 Tax=Mytilus coruscus TaxID=42192 RepID=A0A6J8E065_MYTCO|nr:unnamed protein product [Mytilus coruscus]